MKRLSGFFRDLSREMKKTSWPKGKELYKYTLTVVITIMLVGLFLFAVDTGFNFIFRYLVK